MYLAAPSGSMQRRINVSSRVMVTGPKTDLKGQSSEILIKFFYI
jgi:hypothetical protein